MSKEEEKLKREIMTMSKLRRIPYPVINSKVRPFVKICMRCGRNDVTNHHWLCNKCWLAKKKKKAELNKQRRIKYGRESKEEKERNN